MKRFRALALAGLIAVPVTAAAQQTVPPGQTGRQLPASRFAVTPFVGLRVPFSTGDEFLYTEGETVSSTRVNREHGGSLAAGLEGEYRFTGPWSMVGTLSYSPGTNDDLRITDGDGGTDLLTADGPSMTFARLGVSYRLPEPNPDARRFHPAGFIVVAPALVHLDPSGGDGSIHPALNLGLQATAPLGRSRRLAFQLALDDYIAFWDTDALAKSDAPFFSAIRGEPVGVDYDYSMTNLLQLRLGASFRL